MSLSIPIELFYQLGFFMPRPLRMLYSNAWYHVMNRGAGKRNIFNSNSHRTLFLDLLSEFQRMFNIKIHAYCLMDNHYHLLISTPDANLSRVMRHINGVYTQKYNRSLKTDGSLFRGRYKAQLIENGQNQVVVSRYIHLNPVRAKMVGNASDYKWSSYRAYLGLDKTPAWLCSDEILKQVPDREFLSQIENYRNFVEETENIEMNNRSNIDLRTSIIGSTSFKEKILSKVQKSTAQACAPALPWLEKYDK